LRLSGLTCDLRRKVSYHASKFRDLAGSRNAV
jgi:hypothetical protein